VKPVLKQARYSGTLLALGLTLIFAPSQYLDRFALTEFRNEGRVWIGPTTFILAGVWLVQVVGLCSGGWRRQRARRAEHREMVDLLETLTVDERYQLARCVAEGTSTFYAPITDRTAHSLASKSLAPRLAGGGSSLEWPSVIPPEVWRYLNVNPQVLLRGQTFAELEAEAGHRPLPRLRP
jgi:hypothetical protein